MNENFKKYFRKNILVEISLKVVPISQFYKHLVNTDSRNLMNKVNLE